MTDDTVINITETKDDLHNVDLLPNVTDDLHNVDLMKISPNGGYLVTYSKNDKTFVGWNIEYARGDDTEKDKDIEEDKREVLKIQKGYTYTRNEDAKNDSN